MTTDIARIGEDDRSLAAKVEWAKTLAVANLLPPQYQGNPGNLLYAVEYADALGIDRINAITSIHVIQGQANSVGRAHRLPRSSRRPQTPRLR